MGLKEQLNLWQVESRAIFAVAGWYMQPFKSVIFTKDGVVYSKLKPVEVMEELCVRNGASYRGREEATRVLSNRQFNKKVPVLIAAPNVAAFPTCSPQQLDCIWLFNHRMSFDKQSETITRVTFPTEESILVQASLNSLEKQRGRLFSVVGYHSLHK
ncbi:competence protein ComK [Chryseomicrobium sp. FSL W7-1435]|uniref:competence protein ComK n=1 Tax=Chryseomicrobium sp. FSL W7-1435 TaxID=2921704 RepID=UPI00315A042E